VTPKAPALPIPHHVSHKTESLETPDNRPALLLHFTHDTMTNNYSEKYAHFTDEKMRFKELNMTSHGHKKAA